MNLSMRDLSVLRASLPVLMPKLDNVVENRQHHSLGHRTVQEVIFETGQLIFVVPQLPTQHQHSQDLTH